MVNNINHIFKFLSRKGFLNFDLFLLLFFVFLSFIVRYIVLLSQPSYGLYSDDAVYMDIARSLLDGDFAKIFHPWWSPFFPIVSALFHFFVQDWGLTGRIVSLAFGSLLILPIYLIARIYFDRITTILICFFVIFFKSLVYSSTQSLTEALLVFLIWMGIYLYLKCFQTKRDILAFFSGIFFGLAALTKAEGIFIFTSFLFASTIYLIFFFLRNKILHKQIVLVSIFIFLGFSIIYLPYQIAMQSKYKQSVPLAKASAAANLSSPFNFDSTKTSTWAQDFFSTETFNVKSEFGQGFFSILTKTYKSWLRDTNTRFDYFSQTYLYKNFSAVGMLIFFFGAIWMFFRTKDYNTFTFLFLVPLIFFEIVMFFAPNGDERYIYWLYPLIPLGIAFGSIKLPYIPKKIIKFNIVSLILFFIVFLSSNAFYTPSILKEIKNTSIKKSTIVSQDEWLMNNDPKKRLMSKHEAYGFYSKSLIIYTPVVSDLDELLTYAHLQKADYIIATPAELHPAVLFLSTNPKDYPGLKLINGKKDKQLYKIL